MDEENFIISKKPESSEEFEEFKGLIKSALTNNYKNIGVVDNDNELSIIPIQQIEKIIPVNSIYTGFYNDADNNGEIDYKGDDHNIDSLYEPNEEHINPIKKTHLFIGFGQLDKRSLILRLYQKKLTLNDNRRLAFSQVYKINEYLESGATKIGKIDIKVDGINKDSPGSISGRNIRISGHYIPNMKVGDGNIISIGGNVNITNIYSNGIYEKLSDTLKNYKIGRIQEIKPYNLDSVLIGLLGTLAASGIIYILVSNYLSK